MTAPDAGRSPAMQLASGAWIWDVAADVLRADARFASLTGLDPIVAAAGAPGARFFDGVVPEDLLRVKIAVAAVMRGAESFARTYRVRDAEGRGALGQRARPSARATLRGKVVRFSGELADVTELKRVEQQLRVAQTAGGVGTFEHIDGFGTATVSDQFCRLLGLHPTAALPLRTINSVVCPEETAHHLRAPISIARSSAGLVSSAFGAPTPAKNVGSPGAASAAPTTSLVARVSSA